MARHASPSGLILRYEHLSAYPPVFKALTGMSVMAFDVSAVELMPRLEAELRARRDRVGRLRAPGGGHPFGLDPRDRVLLTFVWLRCSPTYDVLGYLFGVSRTTAARAVDDVLPLLRAPWPGAARPFRIGPDPGQGLVGPAGFPGNRCTSRRGRKPKLGQVGSDP